MMDKKKTVKILLIVLGVVALVSLLGSQWMFSLVETIEETKGWLLEMGLLGKILFVLLVMLQVIIAFLPGEPLEILAGYCFGFWEGTFLSLVGTTLGGAVVFLLVKRYGMSLVRVFFSEKELEKANFLKDSEKMRRNVIVFNTIPGTPKDLLAYMVGLSDMPLKTWLVISAITRIPSVVTSTLGGSAIGMNEWWAAIVIFFITAALSLIALWGYNRYCARRETACKINRIEATSSISH
ncbi:MAG: TVP38/TMEM64 family protein [Erysipelotrichaceae bacterium]